MGFSFTTCGRALRRSIVLNDERRLAFRRHGLDVRKTALIFGGKGPPTKVSRPRRIHFHDGKKQTIHFLSISRALHWSATHSSGFRLSVRCHHTVRGVQCDRVTERHIGLLCLVTQHCCPAIWGGPGRRTLRGFSTVTPRRCSDAALRHAAGTAVLASCEDAASGSYGACLAHVVMAQFRHAHMCTATESTVPELPIYHFIFLLGTLHAAARRRRLHQKAHFVKVQRPVFP